MTIDLRQHAFGLDTEAQRHVDRLLRDYDPNLSLRRVPPTFPAFRPDQPFGVYEEGIRGYQSPWVFFLSEAQIDHRVLARIVENDMHRDGNHAKDKMQSLVAAKQAEAASKALYRMEQDEQRTDEMRVLAKIASTQQVVRHRIGGELVRIGDEITTGKTYV
jgi:hypothetical protein